MSIAEIKKEAVQLRNEDVIHLAAWFHHLARRKDGAYHQSLDKLYDSMDAEDRMSLDDYKAISRNLDQSGL